MESIARIVTQEGEQNAQVCATHLVSPRIFANCLGMAYERALSTLTGRFDADRFPREKSPRSPAAPQDVSAPELI